MHKDIEKIIFSEEEIKNKIKELANRINNDYRGKKLILIGILKGSFIFISDLIRAIDLQVQVDFMAISSYGDAMESSGVVKINKDLDKSIEGQEVLIVEDIIDGGLTMKYLINTLSARNPKSLKTCALLDKKERRVIDVNVDYIGFEIADLFVVGYGLDYAQLYRNLPYIGVLKPEVYKK